MRALRVLLALVIALPALVAQPGSGPLAPRPVQAAGDNCNYSLKVSNKYTAGTPGGTPSFTFLSSAETGVDCPTNSTPQPYCSHGAWGSTFRAPRKDKPDGTPVMAASDTILSDAWGRRVTETMFYRTYYSLYNGVGRANPTAVYWTSGLGELSAETLGMRYIPVSTKRGAWSLIIHQGNAEEKIWNYFKEPNRSVKWGMIRSIEFSFGDGGFEKYKVFSSNGSDNHTWVFGTGTDELTYSNRSQTQALNFEAREGLGRVYGSNGLTEGLISSTLKGWTGEVGATSDGLDALYYILAPSRNHSFSGNYSTTLIENSPYVINMAKASWLSGGDNGFNLPIEIWAREPVDKLNNATGLPGADGTQDMRWEYDPVTGVPLYPTEEEVWTRATKITSRAQAARLKEYSIWNAKIAWPSRLNVNNKFTNIKSMGDNFRVLSEGMSSILGQQRNQRFIGPRATFLVMPEQGTLSSANLQDPRTHPRFGPEWISKFYAPAMRRPYTAAHGSFAANQLATGNRLCNSDVINIGLKLGSVALPIQPYGYPNPQGARGGIGNDYCDMNRVRSANAPINGLASCYFAWVPYQIKPPKLEWQSWVTSQIISYVPKKSSTYVSKDKPGVETPAAVGEPYTVDRAQFQKQIFNHLNAQIDSVNFAGVAKLNFTQVGMTVEIGDPEAGTGFILPVRLEGPDGKGTWTPMISRRLSLGKLDYSNYKVSMVFPRTPAAQAQEPYCRDLSASDLLLKCGVGFDPESNQWYYHIRFRTWWEGAYQVVLGKDDDGKDIRMVYSTFANVDLPKSWTSAQRRVWYGAMRPWDCLNWPRYADPSQTGWAGCEGQRTNPRMFQKAAQVELDYPGRSAWTAAAPYYDPGERWTLYDKNGKGSGTTTPVQPDVAEWGDWGDYWSDPVWRLWAPRPLFDPSVFECWDPVTDPTQSLAKAFGLTSIEQKTWCWMNVPVLQAQGTP